MIGARPSRTPRERAAVDSRPPSGLAPAAPASRDGGAWPGRPGRSRRPAAADDRGSERTQAASAGAPARPLTVVLGDDHPLLRDGLRAVLERRAGIEVIGEAGDGREALRLIEATSPDVAVLDISLPGLSGIEVTRRLHRSRPETRILALSMHDDRAYASEILRAGASGYLLKDAAGSELVSAVEAVARGQRYVCPAMAQKLIEDYLLDDGGRRTPAERDGDLTAREREVLQSAVEGHSNKATAARLGISPKTVEVHRAHIADKLGIYDLPALVRYAIRRGIITP